MLWKLWKTASGLPQFPQQTNTQGVLFCRVWKGRKENYLRGKLVETMENYGGSLLLSSLLKGAAILNELFFSFRLIIRSSAFFLLVCFLFLFAFKIAARFRQLITQSPIDYSIKQHICCIDIIASFLLQFKSNICVA